MGIKQRNVDENGDGGIKQTTHYWKEDGNQSSNGPLGGGKDQTAQKSRMGITRTSGKHGGYIWLVTI